METIQKMVSRRLNDRSHKRNSIRLVGDDFVDDSDVKKDERNERTSNFNPNFNTIGCDTLWSKDCSSSSSVQLDDAVTNSPNSSLASGDESFCKLNTEHISDTDISKPVKEKPLRKISTAVRKKLAMSNPFSSSQKESSSYFEKNSEVSTIRENTGKSSSEPVEKRSKEKSTRRKLEAMDVRMLGRKRENDSRQLLTDEQDED